MRVGDKLLGLLVMLALVPTSGWAQGAPSLSYTFMDFQFLSNRLDAEGVQALANQTVTVNTGGGNGLAVAGAAALGQRFYFLGHFKTSVIDIDGLVQSPFGEAGASGRFDLVQSSIGLGIHHTLARNLDAVLELAYDSVDYDFGSFAGESFDTRERGPAGSAGLRWQMSPAVEVHAGARYSAVARPDLTARQLEPDVTGNVGIRWYVFQDLGLGLSYQTGELRTATASLRFNFGNLPW